MSLGEAGRTGLPSDEHQLRAQEVRGPASMLPPRWRRMDSMTFTAGQRMRTRDPRVWTNLRSLFWGGAREIPFFSMLFLPSRFFSVNMSHNTFPSESWVCSSWGGRFAGSARPEWGILPHAHYSSHFPPWIRVTQKCLKWEKQDQYTAAEM